MPEQVSSALDQTLAAARAEGLSVVPLAAKTDVDTVSDVPASYRAG